MFNQYMRPTVDAKKDKKPARLKTANTMPAELAGVALIDAKMAAAAGAVSLSWWNQKVAAGVAPKPVHCAARHTRWLLSDVVAFWQKFADRASRSEAVIATARKASAAAQAKRRAAHAATAPAASTTAVAG